MQVAPLFFLPLKRTGKIFNFFRARNFLMMWQKEAMTVDSKLRICSYDDVTSLIHLGWFLLYILTWKTICLRCAATRITGMASLDDDDVSDAELDAADAATRGEADSVRAWLQNWDPKPSRPFVLEVAEKSNQLDVVKLLLSHGHEFKFSMLLRYTCIEQQLVC